MEAGLAGAGPIRGQFVIGPLRDQAIGDRRSAVRGFQFAPLDLESAIGNPGLEQLGAEVHKT